MDRTGDNADAAASGAGDSVAPAEVYLSRCQVDTPERLVKFVWQRVNALRPNAGSVVDFGCGDARFARHGKFERYTGFEIDESRGPTVALTPPNKVHIACAFEQAESALGFNVCVGNPPYVRHHDLEPKWLAQAQKRLTSLVAYKGDGRSNAYVYFMWLALASVADDGLVALVIPYEWVSRPASQKLRDFIKASAWDVDIYHIENAAFERVLTTACVAVIDKRASREGQWRLFNVSDRDEIVAMTQVTRSAQRQLAYEKATDAARAIRGLSPGGKQTFLLTEAERIHFQLRVGLDVVPAVSSFRHLEQSQASLSEIFFRKHFVHVGQRCWLLNTCDVPSPALQKYLDQVPLEARDNYTCNARALWWKFPMPKTADILYSSGFKSARPKMFRNHIGAIHVGSIHGIHCTNGDVVNTIFNALQKLDLSKKVVSLSNEFLKVEVRQMNTVLNSVLKRTAARGS